MDGKVAGSLAVLISVLLGALGYNLLFVTYTAPNTVTLPAYADATAYSAMPNLQTGSYTENQGSIDWDKQEYRYFFVMFDLSSLPAGAQVSDIVLKIYISYSSSGQSAYYGINWAETNWAENTITWANQPQFGSGYWEDKLIGGVGAGTGWLSWQVGGTAQRLMNHLTTDKKMAYCISPDINNRVTSSHFFNIRTKQYSGGFDPKLLVTYTIPQYTLTVNAKFSDNTPISGAEVFIDDTSVGKTSVGTISATVTYGSHSVKTVYSGSTQTQSVSLTSDKSIDFQFQAPTKYYDVTLLVKDQLGHPLPASVSAAGQSLTCDSSGRTTISNIADKTLLSISGSVQVGSRTFDGNDSFTVSSASLSHTLTITRRFLWKFYFNYSDGSLPSIGTLTATASKETLTISIVNGYGEDYLLDGQYSFSFSASPAVALGAQSITNDGSLYATIPKTTEGQTTPPGTTTTTTTTSDQTTTPTAPSVLLLTSTHIYILTAALILLGVAALIVGVRRARR